MKKQLLLGLLIFGSMIIYADGIINSMKKELTAVGVSETNIAKAQDTLNISVKKSKIMLINLEQKKMEINKLVIEDADKNWFKINKLFDEMGQINANIYKNRLKTQIDVRKYITKEQFSKAHNSYMLHKMEHSRNKGNVQY